MIWIEIIGPSGIGKSYWYEKFMQQYPEYEPRQLVLNRIYKSEDLTKLPPKIKFMFWVYRMNLYRISNHFKHKLFSYFLKKFQRKSKSIFTTEKDNLIIKKYLENIDFLNEPQIIVLKKIAYFHQKLIEFKFYQFYLAENDIYIAEDGLMHLSPIFIEELQADKVLIFEKDYETLVEQRLKKAKNKPTGFIEFLLNEEDLKNYIHHCYHFYGSKIKSIIQNCKPTETKLINLDKTDVLKEMNECILELKSKDR